MINCLHFGFLLCGGTGATLRVFAHRFGEPAPDLVDPGGRGRRETDVPMRPPRRPCPDIGGLVGGVVVHNDVDIQTLGDAGVGLLQEIRELLGPIVPGALADDEAGGDVEGGEQRGRPVAFVPARDRFM